MDSSKISKSFSGYCYCALDGDTLVTVKDDNTTNKIISLQSFMLDSFELKKNPGINTSFLKNETVINTKRAVLQSSTRSHLYDHSYVMTRYWSFLGKKPILYDIHLESGNRLSCCSKQSVLAVSRSSGDIRAMSVEDLLMDMSAGGDYNICSFAENSNTQIQVPTNRSMAIFNSRYICSEENYNYPKPNNLNSSNTKAINGAWVITENGQHHYVADRKKFINTLHSVNRWNSKDFFNKEYDYALSTIQAMSKNYYLLLVFVLTNNCYLDSIVDYRIREDVPAFSLALDIEHTLNILPIFRANNVYVFGTLHDF